MPAKRKPQTSRYNSTIRRLGQQYPNHATKKSLCIAMEDMEVYLNDAQQQDHQREEQTNYENQLLHDQINRLRTQQRLQEDALEVENSRDHWQLRAQERSDENATLRRQVNQLERTQCDLEQQVQQLQRQLEQRRAQSLPRRDLPRNQPADGQDQRQQQPPIIDAPSDQAAGRPRERIPERVLREHYPNVHPEMQCVFCRALGQHYSDACLHVTDTQQSRDMVRRRERCQKCLEHCERRGYCAFDDL
ncbi:hypothetical protein Q1695_009610 [Nippostrongylus brasiliensis]|nr:hypothetical protein Q1695_009610 [Nippostrongylus brasiliensis]